MADNYSFQSTIASLMEGMDNFVSAKTVVGDPVTLGDLVMLPLVDVAFGMGAGSLAAEKRRNGGGGIGAKISPVAVIVIKNGSTRLINIKNQDGIEKLIDMVPELVDRIMNEHSTRKKAKAGEADEEAYAAARAEAEDEIKELLSIDGEA